MDAAQPEDAVDSNRPPDSGLPEMPASAMPISRVAAGPTQVLGGHQYVRKRMTPGKKPASMTPSRKRRM